MRKNLKGSDDIEVLKVQVDTTLSAVLELFVETWAVLGELVQAYGHYFSQADWDRLAVLQMQLTMIKEEIP